MYDLLAPPKYEMANSIIVLSFIIKMEFDLYFMKLPFIRDIYIVECFNVTLFFTCTMSKVLI